MNNGKYRIFLVAYLVFFTLILFGSFHSFGIFLMPLAKSLKIGRAEISAAISISWICQGISAPLGGALSDRFGPRVVMAAGTVLIGLGYALMSTCSSIAELYVYFGVIIGIGMGPAYTVASSTAAKWFPERRGLMVGIVLTGPGLGRVILPPLSHYLIRSYDVHTAYVILGMLVLGFALPVSALIKAAPKEGAGLASSGKPTEQPMAKGFWFREVMRQPPFWLLFFIWLQVPLAIQLWQVHFFPHVSDRGIPEAVASLLFVFLGTGLIVGRVTWGAVADRVGSIKTLTFVLLLICGAELSAIGVCRLWHVYLVAALFGFSMGGNDVVYVKLVVETFGLRFAGTIIGALALAFALSSSMGPLIAGFVVDETQSYSWGFLIASLALLGALITLYFLKLSVQARPRGGHGPNVVAET